MYYLTLSKNTKKNNKGVETISKKRLIEAVFFLEFLI